MSTVRVLRTAKATLSRSFFLDEIEESATGPVMVSASRLDGTPVDSREAVADGSGGYAYDFPGLDVLDHLVVSWSLTIGGDAMVLDQDRIEVVGGFYFSLVEGRDVDRVLKDPVKFPTDKLIEKRTEAEDECERITGQAWVPRFCREVVSGYGQRAIPLQWPNVRAVRAVSVAGVAYAPSVVAGLGVTNSGLLIREAGWPDLREQIVVEYEHGHDVPNSEIRRAAKIRFKSLLLEGAAALPDSAERRITVDANGGSTVYGSPTAEKTGIPSVDAIYGRYADSRPGFG